MYSKKLFQNSCSFFFKFCICALLLLATALGLGNLLFSSEDGGFLNTSAEDEKITVVIDPGHGGRDGGAVGKDGTLEKDLNLAVALKLKAILESADIQVVMTRETDIELASPDSSHKKADDLKTRLQLAQNQKNAIFISIHMNKFPVEKYCGLQVYYSQNHPDSARLAEQIQSDTRELLMKNNNRKTKASNGTSYLLDRIEHPAILVECGFLSNTEECARLATKDYQKQLATVLFSSISNFYENNQKNVSSP